MSLVKRQKVGDQQVIGYDNNAAASGDSSLSDGIVLDPNTGGGSLMAAGFNPDGTLIATGGVDKLISIWNFDEGFDNVATLVGHKSAITSIAWNSKDDTQFLTSSADKTIGIWDIETGQKLRKLQKHSSVVNQVAYCGEREQLICSCSDDGTILLWDPREKEPVRDFKTEYPLLTCTANHSGNTIYTSGIDPTVSAFDINNFETPLWTAETHKDTVTSLTVSSDDALLFSRSNDGTVRSYNSKSFVSANRARAIPGVYDGSVSQYDNVIRCKTSGNLLVGGSDDKALTVWDVTSRKLLKKMAGHSGSVLDVDIHPDGKTLLSTSIDGTCIVRSV